MFLDWENQHCENDYTTQSNLQIQCNLYQITNGIFFLTYFWLCWVFISVQGLSLVGATRGRSSSWCVGLTLSRPLLLRRTGSRRAGSVVAARHVGSSQTRARTCVPCIGRQILNHCATREAPQMAFVTELEQKMTPNSQGSLEGKKRSWSNQTP